MKTNADKTKTRHGLEVGKTFKGFYRNTRVLENLERRYGSIQNFEEIQDFENKSKDLQEKISKVISYLESNKSGFDRALPGTNTKVQLESYINHLNESQAISSEIRGEYEKHVLAIKDIEAFTKTIASTDKDLYFHIEKETFDKSTDLKHKITLTLLRMVQIPIFIIITYYSVHFAVGFIGEKDLVIPRGLISIVPSSLEKNAQKLATTKMPTTQDITVTATLPPIN